MEDVLSLELELSNTLLVGLEQDHSRKLTPVNVGFLSEGHSVLVVVGDCKDNFFELWVGPDSIGDLLELLLYMSVVSLSSEQKQNGVVVLENVVRMVVSVVED